MLKKMSKVFFVTAIFLWVFSMQGVFAEESNDDENTPLADYLKEIGVFQGTAKGYELEAAANRAQAAVMVVRLLGQEEYAKQMMLPHPFTDVPDWATAAVGYLYEKGLTKGKGADIYGSFDPVDANQYMTFMLRVLTYDDGVGDFAWNTSLAKANELGIVSNDEVAMLTGKKTLLRGDMVLLSYLTLGGEYKNDGQTLLKKLIDTDIVPRDAIMGFKMAPYMADPMSYNTNTKIGFQKAIISAIVHYDSGLVLDMSHSSVTEIRSALEEAMTMIEDLPGYGSIVDSWEWGGYLEELSVDFTYRVSENQYNQAVENAEAVAADILTREITDYQLELAIHDYVINQTDYYLDDSQLAIYTITGVFVDGEAVCQGYADAVYYLCSLTGIEAYMVTGVGGTGNDVESHAWNIVEIDGKPYQLDATWDDAEDFDGNEGIVYRYFNITDTELDYDHDWIYTNYPSCNTSEYNYYIVNKLSVDGTEQLRVLLQQGFNNRVTEMSFKLMKETINRSQLENILQDLYNWTNCYPSIHQGTNIVEVLGIQY